MIVTVNDSGFALVNFAPGETVCLRDFLDDPGFAAVFADAFVTSLTIDFENAGMIAPDVVGIFVLAKNMQTAKSGTLRVLNLSGPAADKAVMLGIKITKEVDDETDKGETPVS